MNADAPHPSGEIIDLTGVGIGLLSSHRDAARGGEAMLRKRYRFAPAEQAEILVALGGDGFLLHTLHRMLEGECPNVPVFGGTNGCQLAVFT